MKKAARFLNILDRFQVETAPGVFVPVQLIGCGEWGLVHGQMNLPCRRLDTGELVTTCVHMGSYLQMIETPTTTDPEEVA